MNPFAPRPLGRTSLRPTALGFGGSRIAGLHRVTSEDQAQQTIGAAFDAGIRYFDTAPHYGYGLSEHRLGHYLRQQPRDSFAISTKVGKILSSPGGEAPPADIGSWVGGLPFSIKVDFSYDGIMRSYEDSLQRLGLNRVDLLLVHDMDPWVLGSHEAVEHHMERLDKGRGWKALEGLRSSGEIKGIGAGINVAGMIGKLIDRFDVDVFLIARPYTLIDQTVIESGEIARCIERGIGIIKGAPYASGVLALGKKAHTRASPVELEKARLMERVCRRHKVDLRAAALQFAYGIEQTAAVIPGMLSPTEVADNISLMKVDIPDLLWDELKRQGLIHGDAPTPRSGMREHFDLHLPQNTDLHQ